MKGENGVTRSIIDDLHSSDIQEIECKVKVLLVEVFLMNFNLRISNVIKWNIKVVLLDV